MNWNEVKYLSGIHEYTLSDADDLVDYKTINLKQLYDEYNKSLFDGELPDIDVIWANTKGHGGRSYATVKKQYGKVIDVIPNKIDISRRYRKTEKEYRAVLIHEMIHVYLYMNKDLSTHGTTFKNKAKELSGKVGFEIPLVDKNSDDRLDISGVSTKPVLAMLKERNDSTYWIAFFQNNPNIYNYVASACRVANKSWGERGDAVYLIKTESPLQHRYTVKRTFSHKLQLQSITPEGAKDILNNGEILASFGIQEN